MNASRFACRTTFLRRTGFSLVEVCLALGIIGFSLVAIIGLIGVGITSSRSSVDETTVSFVAQDVFNRVHADVSTVNTAVPAAQLSLRWSGNTVSYATLASTSSGTGNAAATGCYDRNGSFLVQQNGAFVQQNNVPPVPLYKATVFVRPLPAGAYPPGTETPPPYNQPAGGAGTALPAFLGVTVQIGWPTDASGNVPANASARSTYCFYLPKP